MKMIFLASLLIGGFVSGFAAIPSAFATPAVNADTNTEALNAQVEYKGFVRIAKGRELYVEYIKPAGGKPVAVLLNGLTYRLGCWDAFVAQLRGQGLGLLRYDMVGQGETLLKYASIRQVLPIEKQPEDLALLLDALKIVEPVHLVGLSYGGGVAIEFAAWHPNKVATVILMAPFLGPIAAQDDWIRGQIRQTRMMFPSNPATTNELYDYFLRLIVFTTYPSAEPIVLETPYNLEAVFHLAQGTKSFNAATFANKLPVGNVHMMIGGADKYVPGASHDEFWQSMPLTSRGSRLTIENGAHKIPEDQPKFAAQWVRRILEGDPALTGGHSFSGSPGKGIRQID